MKKLIVISIFVTFLLLCFYNSNAQQNEENVKSDTTQLVDSVFFKLSEGELIGLSELKNIYFSEEEVSNEIKSLVDSLIIIEGKCNCIMCDWPSHCTWGTDCRKVKNVPCSWCCD